MVGKRTTCVDLDNDLFPLNNTKNTIARWRNV